MIFIIPNIPNNLSPETIQKIKQNFLLTMWDFIPDIHPQQEEFAKAFIDIMFNPAPEFGKCRPTVIPVRCGIGKTVCIQAFLSTLDSMHINNIGVIVITDSLDRLKTLSKGEHINSWCDESESYAHKSAYIRSRSDDGEILPPMKKQLSFARYKQFVFVSSQKIKDLDDSELQDLLTYHYNDEDIKRTYMFYDETPIVFETIKITRKEINDIATALAEGIPTSERHRDFVLNSYEKLRRIIIDDFLSFDIHSQKTLNNVNTRDYFVKHFNLKQMTNDDELFFSVIKKYRDHIDSNKSLKSKSYEMLYYLKEIITNGAIVQACKSTKNDLDKYDLSMFYLKDNMKSLTQDIQTFVFDATAMNEPIYKHKSFMIAYNLNFQPTKPLNVCNIDISVNRTNTKNRVLLDALTYDVKERLNGEAALLICYKNIEDYFKGICQTAHFGNVKGLNEWSELDNIVQIGLNRQDPFSYLMTFYFLHRNRYNDLLALDEELSRNEIAYRLSDDFGIFENDPIQKIFISKATADIEQNLFRCSLRDFNSTTTANLYLYCNRKYFPDIADYFKETWGADIIEDNSEIFDTMKQENRKPNKGSLPEKIYSYIIEMNFDTEYTTKDLLSHFGITNKQFQKAKNNDMLKALFEHDYISKGKYKRASSQ